MSMKGTETTTDICYAQKIAHNRYLPQFFFSVITISFTIIIFCYRLFILEASLPRGICIYTSKLNRDRLHRSKGSISKISVLMALSFLSIIIMITITVFSLFDRVQVPLAAAQQENNNNNNNTKFVSLSTISTVIGTGAAATGAVVTVPGVMKTRKQSKSLATYLLKIHNKYDELCRKTEPTDKNKYEYQDFLDTLRCDIIYLLQNGDINENQYKMLDDRITEYLGRIKYLK
jgi:hypothetical protein